MTANLNPIQQLRELGQSVWYDNMYRALIDTGELQRMIDVGVTGLTSNPTIFEKAISSSDDYDHSLLAHATEGRGPSDLFEALAIEDIQAAADLLRPVYEDTAGADGFASLEVNPHLAHDTEGTIQAAQRLFAALDRPNVMIKVPATPEGVPAIRSLIGQGININVTLIFSLRMYSRVREAYLSGLEDLVSAGGDLARVSSVASFFVSRVDTAVDGLIEQGNGDLEPQLGKAAVANAKIAYQDFTETFDAGRFRTLSQHGARAQRPLWASTSTKNPNYSDVMYVETLIGPDTVNTMPDATLAAFLEHGVARRSISEGVCEARESIEALEDGGVSMDAVTTQLMHDGVKAFADSFDQLIDNIVIKRDMLLARSAMPARVSLGKARATVDEAVAALQTNDTVARIWSGDHTLWSDSPTEIVDRLGWLDVAASMLGEVPHLNAFAAQVRQDEFTHAVLLGMGGSSLGPEVLRQCLGPLAGWPELVVLDSTVPAAVRSVAESIDLTRTLFIVSSKSGTTIEPNTLYKYFRRQVEAVVGVSDAGSRFVAVTDPGTPLESLARRDGFRRVFLNPDNIGGRYSVMSFFGLVPAVVAGYDIRRLLDGAVAMQTRCAPGGRVADNPGAWLGAVVGSIAGAGRDKLPLLCSPSLEPFGLWVEQLIAESLGKDGRGIVPIVGEPPGAVADYGDDRQFVCLTLTGEDSPADALADRLAADGHPVIRYELDDIYALGAEFYRWEFAVATAGAVMRVHPFDQPDVQRAKELTQAVLDSYELSGRAPELESRGSLVDLVRSSEPGDYLAILAYLHQDPEVDSALSGLRSALLSDHRLPTTFGYGPRYLHSTGQLHKGGSDNVAALVLTAPHTEDIEIPDSGVTFGVLADAQAAGDIAALRSAGLRTVSLVLDGAPDTAIQSLTESLSLR